MSNEEDHGENLGTVVETDEVKKSNEATRFKPGSNRLPNSGRPKGTPNKATLEARKAASSIVDDPIYRRNLRKAARERTLQPAVETMLWYYAKGKPKETIELEGSLDVVSRREIMVLDAYALPLPTLRAVTAELEAHNARVAALIGEVVVPPILESDKTEEGHEEQLEGQLEDDDPAKKEE